MRWRLGACQDLFLGIWFIFSWEQRFKKQVIHNNENMTIFHVCLLPRSITRCDYMFKLSLFYQNKVQFDWFT